MVQVLSFTVPDTTHHLDLRCRGSLKFLRSFRFSCLLSHLLNLVRNFTLKYKIFRMHLQMFQGLRWFGSSGCLR